jgi:hypothetical protein
MNFQRIIILVFAILILVTIAAMIFLPESLAYFIIKERGPVENAQVFFYVTGAIVSWIYARQKIWKGGYHGSLILLIFALRELDFHKKFTGISITRTKYYFHSDAAFFAKLLSALIVISIIVLFILFIKKNIKVFFQDVRANKNWALSVLAGLVCIILAIFVDSSLSNLELLGMEVSRHGHIIKIAVEELIELAIPFFFLNSLLLYSSQNTKTKKG